MAQDDDQRNDAVMDIARNGRATADPLSPWLSVCLIPLPSF